MQRQSVTSSVVQLRVPVQVRHERDPYLYFLDISEGTLNFGLTTKEVCASAVVLVCTAVNLAAVVHAWSSSHGHFEHPFVRSINMQWIKPSADLWRPPRLGSLNFHPYACEVSAEVDLWSCYNVYWLGHYVSRVHCLHLRLQVRLEVR